MAVEGGGGLSCAGRGEEVSLRACMSGGFERVGFGVRLGSGVRMRKPWAEVRCEVPGEVSGRLDAPRVGTRMLRGGGVVLGGRMAFGVVQ